MSYKAFVNGFTERPAKSSLDDLIGQIWSMADAGIAHHLGYLNWKDYYSKDLNKKKPHLMRKSGLVASQQLAYFFRVTAVSKDGFEVNSLFAIQLNQRLI